MTDLQQQFAGNYVKLVNQNRELQEQVRKLTIQLIELQNKKSSESTLEDILEL